MHLIVPFAAPLSENGRAALAQLKTPALDAFLASCREDERDEGDESMPHMPHERALARALGWPTSGALPWAARWAAADGIDVRQQAWGLLTPVHWRLGADAVHLADPAALALDEAASRALFDAIKPLFDGEGFTLSWAAPLRWYAAHADLTHLTTASLDRVIGRNVDRWLPAQPEARRLRRLQAEAQMLLHTHPINTEREAAGLLSVNSFWLSGCGVHRPANGSGVQLDERLAAPARAEDWAAWAAAWRALDATMLPTRPLQTLTLCGERNAIRFERNEQRLWQRMASALRPRRAARQWLETL